MCYQSDINGVTTTTHRLNKMCQHQTQGMFSSNMAFQTKCSIQHQTVMHNKLIYTNSNQQQTMLKQNKCWNDVKEGISQ